jgi:uncharacterized membrane-anchored protein YjiN (DUF445 family)
MGLRTAISKKSTRLLKVVFGGFILLYFAVGFYFFVNGLVLISGGGLLIGLACWGGVALFATPLWLMAELKVQSELLRYQNQLLRVLVEDSSRHHHVSPTKDTLTS